MKKSVQDWLDDPATTEAERALIEGCQRDGVCIVGDLPPAEGEAPTVRADLIRLLATSSTDAFGLHESGVWLQGARITGELGLSYLRCRGRLALRYCRFEEQPTLAQTELAQLSLIGSHLPKGLIAQGVKVTGSLFLRGITAKGEVNLAGAEIGGQLACDGATFDNAGGYALDAQDMRSERGIIFRGIILAEGRIDLTSAYVNDLVDDAESWAKCDQIVLDGFTYDRITGDTAPKTFAARRDWLAAGSVVEGEFRPQPYTQFAKVMRAAGHEAEARKALRERDVLLNAAAVAADRKALGTAQAENAPFWQKARIRWRLHRRQAWGWLADRLIGHGHRPDLALLWSLWFWLGGAAVYFIAYRCGLMVPNSAVIMTSAEWLAAVTENPAAPTAIWTAKAQAAAHYESFFAAIFALDMFLPIVDLGQESTWAVTTPTTLGWGWWLRVAGFLYQVMGWVVTSLGIAAVTGLIQRNSPE